MKAFLVFLLITAALPVQAYIPRIDTIVKKMVRNNGRRSYKIVREVTFENSQPPLRAKETWVVKNGDNIKLTVESSNPEDPWKFEILYEKGKRKTLSSTGNLKSFNRSEEFFEALFHDRYHKSLMKRMVNFRVLPDWALTIREPSYEEGETQITKEPFVKLEPSEGSITYAIGAQQNTTGDQWQTTLWVEQDSFLIRKGRLRSKAEFTNDEFQSFPGGLKLPKKQTVSWGDRVARVQLITAEVIRLPKKKKLKLDTSNQGRIPSDQAVKEFYSRFR